MLEELLPLQTGLGKLCMRSRSPQNKTTVRKPERIPRKGVPRLLPAPQRWVLDREACGNLSPKSRAEGGDRGAENREKSWEKQLGNRQEHGVLAPIFLRGSGEQSRRWPWRWRIDRHSLGYMLLFLPL